MAWPPQVRIAFTASAADPEQTLGMHVAEVLDRKRRFAVVMCGAGRERRLSERSRLIDR